MSRISLYRLRASIYCKSDLVCPLLCLYGNLLKSLIGNPQNDAERLMIPREIHGGVN